MDILTSTRALRGWAIASLVANMGIIWTGSLVRLTASGLGCPTWPQCTPDSYVPQAELGIHGAIEFGNRLLTFVLAAIALGMFLAAWRAVASGRLPRHAQWLAFGIGLGIIAQAVIGGISVLTQLNPWVVGLHMAASVVLIALAMELVHLTYQVQPVDMTDRLRMLASSVFWLGMVTVVLGVVTTGAGPNAGDGAAQRNGLSLEWAAKVHAWSVWLLVAITVLALVLAWHNVAARRLWAALLAIELLQGAIGYAQYFLHLPIALVFAHMVGTTLFVAMAVHLWRRSQAPAEVATPRRHSQDASL